MPINKEPSAIGAALVFFPNEDLEQEKDNSTFLNIRTITPPIFTSIDCYLLDIF